MGILVCAFSRLCKLSCSKIQQLVSFPSGTFFSQWNLFSFCLFSLDLFVQVLEILIVYPLIGKLLPVPLNNSCCGYCAGVRKEWKYTSRGLGMSWNDVPFLLWGTDFHKRLISWFVLYIFAFIFFPLKLKCFTSLVRPAPLQIWKCFNLCSCYTLLLWINDLCNSFLVVTGTHQGLSCNCILFWCFIWPCFEFRFVSFRSLCI